MYLRHPFPFPSLVTRSPLGRPENEPTRDETGVGSGFFDLISKYRMVGVTIYGRTIGMQPDYIGVWYVINERRELEQRYSHEGLSLGLSAAPFYALIYVQGTVSS